MNEDELATNPFLVLALPLTASRSEVERAGQKLLAQLALGVSSVKSYGTPFGPRARDESLVRAALSVLRDPEQRALHELWLCDIEGDPQRLPGWPSAFRSIGWRSPCTG